MEGCWPICPPPNKPFWADWYLHISTVKAAAQGICGFWETLDGNHWSIIAVTPNGKNSGKYSLSMWLCYYLEFQREEEVRRGQEFCGAEGWDPDPAHRQVYPQLRSRKKWNKEERRSTREVRRQNICRHTHSLRSSCLCDKWRGQWPWLSSIHKCECASNSNDKSRM